MKAKFQQRYADEVKRQLQTTAVKQIKVDVNQAVVKNPSASWLISVWRALEKRPGAAINGFKKAGIIDAIDMQIYYKSLLCSQLDAVEPIL